MGKSGDIEAVRQALAGIAMTSEPAKLRTKSRDYYWYSPILRDELDDVRADLVGVPADEREAVATLAACCAHEVPVTPRGAGTGLAGGATTEQGGLSLSLNRMDRILRVDEPRMLAWVQPGLVNLWLSQQLAPAGLYFAPDPASQQVSTVGGNVSTNAGGPHCLKYGVTLNHVLGIVAVLAGGEAVTLGGEAPDAPGFDLL